jgi:xanthine dehydrogenase accessory factor
MRDILDKLDHWYAENTRFALATVVSTWSSAPRTVGASMAVSESGEVVGSVSGGCVEGAVYELALEVLATGAPVLQRYGVADSDALEVGLTCGGTLEIYVELVDHDTFPELPAVVAAHRERDPVVTATVTAGPGQVGRRVVVVGDHVTGDIDHGRFRDAVVEAAQGLLAHGTTSTLQLGAGGERRMVDTSVFVESFVPAPEMIVFGAIDFAAAVVRIGKFLGYHVTVCDARPVFATRARFADADEVVVDWPHRFLERHQVDSRAVLCVLTHDPKFDLPLLQVALRTPAAFIGAMGSRRTHENRIRRLLDAGVTATELERLSSPVGLDLGGRTPEETAVSIAAEIIARTWGGTGQPLKQTTDAIHRQPLVGVPL